LLGGSVSPDTRAILLSGDHPMIASGAVEAAAAASAEVNEADADMMAPGAQPRRQGARRNQVMRRPGQIPRLEGLAQIIGLALGSPEFQRR
ncbi:MAG: hypothetical protein WD553_00440, partial [Gemmatimonadaceae bacterium]